MTMSSETSARRPARLVMSQSIQYLRVDSCAPGKANGNSKEIRLPAMTSTSVQHRMVDVMRMLRASTRMVVSAVGIALLDGLQLLMVAARLNTAPQRLYLTAIVGTLRPVPVATPMFATLLVTTGIPQLAPQHAKTVAHFLSDRTL